MGFQGSFKDIEDDFPFLLSTSVGISDGFKFGEGLLIIKGALFKPLWILKRISLVEHHLILV